MSGPENRSTNGTQAGNTKRTFRGLFVKPREQMKFSFMFVSGGLLFLMIFIGMLIGALNRTLNSIEVAYGLDPEVGLMIRNSVTQSLGIALLLALLLAVFAVVAGIQISHRVYGPVVPFLRHIEELIKGNYKSRVKLRKADEFTEIQDSLNKLAETLDAKGSSKL